MSLQFLRCILKETILGLKSLNLPIILVSHAKISLGIQELVDYSLYEKNNLLIKETELLELIKRE